MTSITTNLPLMLYGGGFFDEKLYAYERNSYYGNVVFHIIEAATGVIINSVPRPEFNQGAIVSALSYPNLPKSPPKKAHFCLKSNKTLNIYCTYTAI